MLIDPEDEASNGQKHGSVLDRHGYLGSETTRVPMLDRADGPAAPDYTNGPIKSSKYGLRCANAFSYAKRK